MVNIQASHFVVTLQNQTIPVSASTYEQLEQELMSGYNIVKFWDFGHKVQFVYRSELIVHLMHQSTIARA